MKIIKILIYILLYAVATFTLFYVAVYALWYKAIKDENKKVHEINFTSKSFNGKIDDINEYRPPYKIVLGITTDKGEQLTYGAICVNDEFINFVSVNDSISKVAQSEYVTIYNKNGQKKSFKLKFCS